MAGKGGLNLTHGEALDRFVSRYSGPEIPAGFWEKAVGEFDPGTLRSWAADLGVETFQATSGRVYPKALKAAPLLRRWIERLRTAGVDLKMNHRWLSLEPGAPHRLVFSNGESDTANAVIFALGGGSWSKTGSDGGWVDAFREMGVECNSLVPANCGWEHEWPAGVLASAEGQPLKNIHVSAAGTTVIGELMVTRYGLEGGAIYQLGAILRAMDAPAIAIDFKPTFTRDQLVAKMESVRKNFLKEAAVRWKLSEAALAILSTREYDGVESLAEAVKRFMVPLSGPRPLDEVISSAGGVRWSGLDENLMIRSLPGVFVAGEMLDWEAPTGGYLMQGCFATGTLAAKSAVGWLGGR